MATNPGLEYNLGIRKVEQIIIQNLPRYWVGNRHEEVGRYVLPIPILTHFGLTRPDCLNFTLDRVWSSQ